MIKIVQIGLEFSVTENGAPCFGDKRFFTRDEAEIAIAEALDNIADYPGAGWEGS